MSVDDVIGDVIGTNPIISTRILGRRTAPFPPFLIPSRIPHGFHPRILVLTARTFAAECEALGVADNTFFFYTSDHGFQLGTAVVNNR